MLDLKVTLWYSKTLMDIIAMNTLLHGNTLVDLYEFLVHEDIPIPVDLTARLIESGYNPALLTGVNSQMETEEDE